MGRIIYVDTGFLIALFDPNDSLSLTAHRLLSAFRSDERVRLALPWDVINEFLAHFSRRGSETRKLVARFIRTTLRDGKYIVENVDLSVYTTALDLYEQRLDKRYSMVDCIGMTVMRRECINEVVTTDRDFVQEGFLNLMGRTA